MAVDLRKAKDFGQVAAEDDAVLDYFLSTDTVKHISDGRTVLVVGRKGSGKTALVRYFSEGSPKNLVSRAVRMEKYPWGVHARRANTGASEADAYVASWEFLMAVEFAALVAKTVSEEDRDLDKIRRFLKDNYGDVDASAANILQPESIKVSGSLEPSVLGIKLFKIDFKRPDGDTRLGAELTATSDALFTLAGRALKQYWRVPLIMLHIDELDHGMTTLESSRSNMLIGVILAARNVARRFAAEENRLCPVVYLRSDIWDALRFSDKNKILQTYSHEISWSDIPLRNLVERRAKQRLGVAVDFSALEDGAVLRGQESKWNHILRRTHLRPRDVVQFMNCALDALKSRPSGPTVLTNDDIRNAKEAYSRYLKRELDDEIPPHWPDWEDAMHTISEGRAIVFSFDEFAKGYKMRSSTKPADALQRLFEFSVIGYRRPQTGGGSRWVFRHLDSSASWDPGARLFKVHLGLKEFYRLKDRSEASAQNSDVSYVATTSSHPVDPDDED